MERIVKESALENGFFNADHRGNVYAKRIDNEVHVLLVYSEKSGVTREVIADNERNAKNAFASDEVLTVEVMHLLVREDGNLQENDILLADGEFLLWYLAEDSGSVISFESQPVEWNGLRKTIESKALAEINDSSKSSAVIPWITDLLVVINLVVFFFAFKNEQVIRNYALEWPYVIVGGQWYRLITAMFLHFDVVHITNNMTVLLIAGMQLEKKYGNLRFVLIYMISGLVASVASLVYHFALFDQSICAGASGAVYGVIGAYVAYIIFVDVKKHRISRRDLMSRMTFVAMMIIAQLVFATGIDHVAHLAGMVTGFLIGMMESFRLKNS